MIDGVNVGRYLQTYSKTDFGPRLGLAYDLDGSGRTVVRGWGMFWNFTPGGTSSSKAQNPPFLQATTLTTNLGRTSNSAKACRRRPASIRIVRRQDDAVDFRHQRARRLRAQLQRERPASDGHELPRGGCLRGLPRPATDAQGRSEPGAAHRRCDQCGHQSAASQLSHRRCARSAAFGAGERWTTTRSSSSSIAGSRTAFRSRTAHPGQDRRLELGQRRHRDADQRLRPRIQPRAGRTTTSDTPSARTGSTSCPGRRTRCMAAGR